MVKKLYKKGAFSDLFIFMIMSFALLVISGVFIYIGSTTKIQLHATMDDMSLDGSVNVSEVIDDTMGAVDSSFQSLYWISVFIMVGMILSILIGSYLVTTKPIFFIPYIFVVIIAVIVSVGISNAYESIATTPELASIFANFIGANFIMSKLPIWVTVIGFLGGIIMFSRLGSKEEQTYYG